MEAARPTIGHISKQKCWEAIEYAMAGSLALLISLSWIGWHKKRYGKKPSVQTQALIAFLIFLIMGLIIGIMVNIFRHHGPF